MIYRCFYKFYDVIENVDFITYCDVDAILEAKNGFWINENFKFTLGSDCKFWVPESRILYIEKRKS